MNFRRLLPSIPLTISVIAFWMIMVADLSLVQWVFAIILGVVILGYAAYPRGRGERV